MLLIGLRFPWLQLTKGSSQNAEEFVMWVFGCRSFIIGGEDFMRYLCFGSFRDAISWQRMQQNDLTLWSRESRDTGVTVLLGSMLCVRNLEP